MSDSFFQYSFGHSIPFKLDTNGETPLCHWVIVDDDKTDAPFFDEAISFSRHRPENSKRVKCVSDVDILREWSGGIDSIAPTAIIFHVSRCGSTLASQLLGLSEENISLSEVPFLDQLLRWTYDNNKIDYSGYDNALSFYAVKTNAAQKRLFIKADSWHMFFYDQLRALYPSTPFILLYRHPAEVIRSQQKLRGMQAIPALIDPKLFGFEEAVRELPLDHYMAKLLEKYYSQFIQIAGSDPLATLINYEQGATAMIDTIASVINMPIDAEYRKKINERCGYHAKYPEQAFAEEAPRPVLPQWCDAAIDLYARLDEMRLDKLK